MEEDGENTTTDEIPQDSLLYTPNCKLALDIVPRKVPKSIVQAQIVKLEQLKKHVHGLKIENEGLKAENNAMKKNIERYYELVIQAREKKKIKGHSNVSTATLCAGIIVACTVHLSVENDENYAGERRLMFLKTREWSILAVYLSVLAVIVFGNWIIMQRKKKNNWII